MSDTGDTPREITHEILKTLQMLTIEPETGYQPLLSLSLLCNILAACISQAAYRPNWSIIEHILTLTERTITAKNESAHQIMLDMSKAFDCINRNKLIEDLRNNIEADEQHIIFTLLNISLSVGCENALSEVFDTDTGAPQGDSESALDLTYYLAKTLDRVKCIQPLDHLYVEQTIRSNIAGHLTELNYCIVTQEDQADIGKLTSKHIFIEVSNIIYPKY